MTAITAVLTEADSWAGNPSYQISFGVPALEAGFTVTLLVTEADAGWTSGDPSPETELLVNILKAGMEASEVLDSPTIHKYTESVETL